MTADLPRLRRAHALAHRAEIETGPAGASAGLPEKAVQFGTGAFLRAFIDVYLDDANSRGAFNGRVVAIASTTSERDRLFREQDGLFTLVTEGLEDGVPRRSTRLIGAVSRALSAADDWHAVLACACNPWLELVFSNTTEVGITLDEGEPADLTPPRSFPGKLTRFLYERARTFAFADSKGVAVIPCELIESNGDRLRETVLTLADRWELGAAFSSWVTRAVPFYNTLVDRIVPGSPPRNEIDGLWEQLGYRDELITVCEPYRLFAIQGDESARRRLSFAAAAPTIVIAEDIAPFRERKVRLLNGAHTIIAPLALLAGCRTVADAMGHDLVGPFVRRVMLEEIVPSLAMLPRDAETFAHQVLERFANPFIKHALLDITLYQTTKLRVRVVPSIVGYAARTGRAPAALALGFAAYLLFMRDDAVERVAGRPVPNDVKADAIRALWRHAGEDDGALVNVARSACADRTLWGEDLTSIAGGGFADLVADLLVRAARNGVAGALESHLAAATL